MKLLAPKMFSVIAFATFGLVQTVARPAHADSMACSGLWAGVESILSANAVVTTSPDGTPSPLKLIVNNAEFQGSMMAAGANMYSFNVRRVGSNGLVLTGSMRFLTSVTEPAKPGFVLHTSDNRIEAILTCDPAK